MPTIKEVTRFNFDGVWSDSYGLLHAMDGSGLYNESLFPNRDLVETQVRGGIPIFNKVEMSPIEFEMTLVFATKYTNAVLENIVKWLFTETYKPLYFENKTNKIFMCMPIGSSEIIHDGNGNGFINISMRCNSPYIYSPLITTVLETVTTNKTISIITDTHYNIFPEISIVKNGVGNITIEQITDGNKVFEIRDLTNLEDIYIDCKKEIIQTNVIGVYRYDKVTGSYPKLITGTNQIKVTGSCTIQFRFKNLYKF